MLKTGIILKKDLNELRSSNAFRIICIAFLLITIAVSLTASIMLARREWISEKAAEPLLNIIIGLIAYFIPLAAIMTFIWGFSSLPVIKEKVNGNIASLIATTLTPGEVWMGKSLAIFIPGYIISVISTVLTIVTINLAAIMPATGNFIFPVPLFLVSLVWNPLLLLGTLLFIILFSLAGNPDIAFAPSFIVGFGLMMGIPIGMVKGSIDLVSWSFSLWYLAGTALVLIITFLLSMMLTKEKIMLSGKGD